MNSLEDVFEQYSKSSISTGSASGISSDNPREIIAKLVLDRQIYAVERNNGTTTWHVKEDGPAIAMLEQLDIQAEPYKGGHPHIQPDDVLRAVNGNIGSKYILEQWMDTISPLS